VTLRRAAAGLLVLGVLLAVPAAASAHATLEATVPERGAALARAPAEVVFRFDEPVDAGLGGVRVVDARGNQVQAGRTFHPGGRGAEVAVRLPSTLGDGGYTATCQVVSADSHPVSGGFTFTVGPAGAAARSVAGLLDVQRAGPVRSTAFAAVRAVQYAAIALALGALIFLAACWWPGLAAAGTGGTGRTAALEAFARRLRVLLLGAGAAGLVSALAGIALEGAAGQGTPVWQALRPSVIGEVLGTRFGLVWALAAGAWTLLALYAAVLGRAPGRREAALLALPVAPLVLLPGAAGHASVEPPVALLLPANVLHVLAMSAWLGGIAVLVLGLRPATARLEGAERTGLLVAVVGRFSRIAGGAFAVLLATGAAQAVVEVASVHALVDTAFGRAVLIKLVLLAVLVALGWAHRSRTLPALRGATAEPGPAGVLLRRLLRAELALGVAVLAVTGALAGYVPARDVSAGPWSGSAHSGPARLEVTVDPAAPGPNQIHLYLLDARTGAQYRGAKEVTVTASLPERRIGALALDARRAGPGHYVAAGTLGTPGRWRLVVTVRVSAFDEHVARFAVPVR
jgi:copper transport protein